MPIAPLIAAAAAVGACLLAWVALAAVRTSAPVALADGHKLLTAEVEQLRQYVRAVEAQVTQALESHELKMVSWRGDLEGLIETAEDLFQRTERKRRSAAASASRAAGNGEEQQPLTREQWAARARAQGVDVL